MKNGDSTSMFEELNSYCLDLQVISSPVQSTEISARFQFPSYFVGFQGHFPGKPVMPAIVQLALVRYVSEKGLAQELIPRQYKKTKFTGMVQPGDSLSVSVTLKQGDSHWVAQFFITLNNETRVSSGEVTFSN